MMRFIQNEQVKLWAEFKPIYQSLNARHLYQVAEVWPVTRFNDAGVLAGDCLHLGYSLG